MAFLSRGRRRRRALVSLLVLSGIAAWWASAPFRDTSAQAAVGIHKVQGAVWRPELGQPLFVAIMGSDVRKGPPDAGGGCDAIHIIAINPTAKAGTILNFPRDSFLEGEKITNTCRRKGFDAVAGILTRHTRLPVQYLVRTEFSNFVALVEELGGLDITVPYAMSDPPSGAFFKPGTIHMGGGQLLSFSRNRKEHSNRPDRLFGDFARTDNQGLVILAALAKFRAEADDAHRIFDYIRAVRRHTKITVPIGELIRMALLAREIDPANVQNITIPGSAGSAGSASVVFVAPGDIYDRIRDDAVY